MSTHHDGGPAFPCPGQSEHWGMSLRDAFAIAAMQGICAHPDTWGLSTPEIADHAYLLADEMVRARVANLAPQQGGL